jgi:GcrA cell cycle regulator
MMWTDEKNNMLRSMWADGFSGSQIAAELGAPLTRSAVIGKAHRLGLAARVERKLVLLIREPKCKPQPRLNAVIEKKQHHAEPITLMELIDCSCRWPVNEDVRNMLYCGKPGASLSAGRPYCEHHARMAVRAQSQGLSR